MRDYNNDKVDILDIKTTFQILSEDVRATKNNQWQLAYYGLLFQAAIVGGFSLLKENVKPTTDNIWTWHNIVLMSFSITAIIFVFFMVLMVLKIYDKYQSDLKFYRAQADTIINKCISENYKVIRKINKRVHENRDSKIELTNKLYIFAHKGSFVAGGVFVIFYFIIFIVSIFAG